MTDEHAAEPIARHFSLCNPEGPGQDDIPRLLRRFADEVAALGEVEVLDIVMNNEVHNGLNRPCFTVYYSRG